MVDVLFLLGERPPMKEDHKKFSIIEKTCKDILSKCSMYFEFVVTEPDTDKFNKKNILKSELENNLQRICNVVDEKKPKVIVAMGQHAFKMLRLDNSKITEIQCTPTTSPVFGEKVVDLRTTKKALAQPYTPYKRGVILFNNIHIVGSQHTPLIWPCHKHDQYFAFHSNYKGITYFKDQMACVKNLIDEETFFAKHPSWFDKFLVYHDNLDTIKETTERLSKEKRIAFDIETAGPGIPKEAQLDPYHEKACITCIAIGEFDTNNKRIVVHIFDTINMPSIVPYISKVLSSESTKYSWNGKFDIKFLRVLWCCNVRGVHIDGMVCLHLYDMGRASMGKGASTLKTNSALYLSPSYAGYHKYNRLDVAMKEGDGDFLGKNWKEFLQYCGIDVYVTFALVPRLWNKLAKKTKKLAVEHYKDLYNTLDYMHDNGMLIDVDLLEYYIKELSFFCDEISECANKKVNAILIREGIDSLETSKGSSEFSIQSKQNIAEVMYDILKLPPTLTDKGNYTVNKDVLHKYADNELVETILIYNYFVQQLRLMETLKKHTDDNNYCYPFYDDMRTASGRLSCRNPNIQQMSSMAVKDTIRLLPDDIEIKQVEKDEGVKKLNIKGEKDPVQIEDKEYTSLVTKVVNYRPIWKTNTLEYDKEKNSLKLTEMSPKFKKTVIAPEGYTLVYADYAQIEIYVLGSYISFMGSTDMTLQTALLQGLDIHSFTTSKIYTILNKQDYSYEFIYNNKNKMPYKLWRGNAKTVLFSLIYGKGYQTFAKETGVPEEDAKALFDVFLKGFPGIKEYMDWSYKQAKQHGSADTFMGHQRKIEVLKYQSWNKKGKNQSFNTPIQGSAGTVVLTALNKLYQEGKTFGARPAFTVHDSIGMYMPTQHLDYSIEVMRWCMEKYPSIHYPKFLVIPLKIDLGICNPSWADEEEYNLKDNKHYRKVYQKDESGKWIRKPIEVA